MIGAVKEDLKAILKTAFETEPLTQGKGYTVSDEVLQSYIDRFPQFKAIATQLENTKRNIGIGAVTQGSYNQLVEQLSGVINTQVVVPMVRQVELESTENLATTLFGEEEAAKYGLTSTEGDVDEPIYTGDKGGAVDAVKEAYKAVSNFNLGRVNEYDDGSPKVEGEQIFRITVDSDGDTVIDTEEFVRKNPDGSFTLLSKAPEPPVKAEDLKIVDGAKSDLGEQLYYSEKTGNYYSDPGGTRIYAGDFETKEDDAVFIEVVGEKQADGKKPVYAKRGDTSGVRYADPLGLQIYGGEIKKSEVAKNITAVGGVKGANEEPLFQDSDGNYYTDPNNDGNYVPYAAESVVSNLLDTEILERVNAEGFLEFLTIDSNGQIIKRETTDIKDPAEMRAAAAARLEEEKFNRGKTEFDKTLEQRIAEANALDKQRGFQNQLEKDRFKLDSELGRAAQSLNESRFNVEQLQFNANMAENARQFDEANRLNALAQQENARATNLEAGFQINKARSDAIDQVREILRNPADYVARGFSLAGQESPFTPVTQADLINKVTDDYNAYNDMLSTMGQGFDAQDYLGGRQGFAGGLEVEEAEHGGTFGNPVIVGDSSDGKENQELVMTANGAPMVVLPLTDQQINILQGNKNNNIPMAENGFQNPPEFNEFGESTTDPLTGRTDWSKVDTGGTIAPQGSMYSTKNNPMGTSQPSSMNFGTTTNQLTSFNDFVGFGNRMGQVGFGGTVVNQLPQRNLTQQDIIQQAERFGTPRVSRVAQGFSPMPMQFGFPLMSPGQLSSLTPDEREELRTRLATRNVSLGDVEQAVMQRFGPTGTRRGRRRF